MAFSDIEDLAVDENFEIFISKSGDLAGVSGRDAFEQKIRVRITERASELIGTIEEKNIIDLLETEIERVAANMDELDSIASFSAEQSESEFNQYVVTIVYDTGQELQFNT